MSLMPGRPDHGDRHVHGRCSPCDVQAGQITAIDRCDSLTQDTERGQGCWAAASTRLAKVFIACHPPRVTHCSDRSPDDRYSISIGFSMATIYRHAYRVQHGNKRLQSRCLLLDCMQARAYCVNESMFSDDGGDYRQWVYTGHETGVVNAWNVMTGRRVHRFPKHKSDQSAPSMRLPSCAATAVPPASSGPQSVAGGHQYRRAITCIHACHNIPVLFTGAKDGSVRQWCLQGSPG